MLYEEHIKQIIETKTLSIGDDVKVLIDYSLCSGTVVKVNPKGIKVHIAAGFGCVDYVSSFKPEKVFKIGTLAVLVWELWKGKNGRGGYRVDTLMYSELARPIETIKSSVYLYEDSFGCVVDQHKKLYADSLM